MFFGFRGFPRMFISKSIESRGRIFGTYMRIYFLPGIDIPATYSSLTIAEDHYGLRQTNNGITGIW